MKKSAFTLIELLVVISIIAILASLSIPAFTKVLDNGKGVQDAANLKQLGLGIVGYTNDNSDSYPTSSGYAPLLNGTSGTVYIPLWKVFQSPFDKRTSSESGGANSPISYAFNTYLSGLGTSDVASTSSCAMLAVLMDATYPLTAVSGTTLNTLKIVSPTVGTFNGGKFLNVLYADGHVSKVKASLITSTTGGSGTASGIAITSTFWNH